MVLKGFPNGVTQGQQYNIGEKPTVTLYTYSCTNGDREIFIFSVQLTMSRIGNLTPG